MSIEKHYPRRISKIGLMILIPLFMLANKYGFEEVFGNNTLCFTFLIFPMILTSVVSLKTMQKILGFKLVVYLGKISKAIYLLHFPLLNAVGNIYRGGG